MPRRPERNSADTRSKILEIAEKEFARQGFEGAHLQRIALQVGVQKTALYYYFQSKAALYEAVLVRMIEALDSNIAEAVEGPGGPAEQLDALLDGINDLLAERRNYSQILIRIFVDRAPIQGEELRPAVERVTRRLLRFFKGGIDAQVFAKCSARHLFQSAIGALFFHYATGEFGAAILGVESLFTSSAVAWRRDEVRRLGRRAILIHPPG